MKKYKSYDHYGDPYRGIEEVLPLALLCFGIGVVIIFIMYLFIPEPDNRNTYYQPTPVTQEIYIDTDGGCINCLINIDDE